MAAQLMEFNFDPVSPLKVSDATTLLVMHNFCLDNLKTIFETIIANKKAQDQLKDNNDLMNYMILVLEVMEEFQLRINESFYHNKELEENEFLLQILEEERERLEVLYRLFSEANSIQLESQRIRALEYSLKKSELDTERKVLLDQLRAAKTSVHNIITQVTEKNKMIEIKFNQIIDNIHKSQSLPVVFEFDGIKLLITQDQVAQGIRDEFKDDIRNGTFELESAKPRIKNVFVKLGISQLEENNIEKTVLALSEVNQIAERESDNYLTLLNNDKNIQEFREIVHERNELNTALAVAESFQENVESKLSANAEKTRELNAEYDVKEVKDETIDLEATEEKIEALEESISEDDLDDPYGGFDDRSYDDKLGDTDNNSNLTYEDYSPPPGEPVNNNYPNQPPPSYEADVSQQPAPSAPPQEDVGLPAPSAPLLEEIYFSLPSVQSTQEAAIPNEPAPAYVEQDDPILASAPPIQPVNHAEAKNADPLPKNNADLKISELKEIKSSGGILGKLGVSAESLRKDIENKKVEAARSQENKSKHPVNQGGVLAKSKQNEPTEPERNGPSHRR